MIITLIGLGLLVVGIILAIIHEKKHFRKYNTKEKIAGLGIGAIFIGGIVTFCSIIFVFINVTNYDVEYQNTLHTREMLEYRIEHYGRKHYWNEMLYNDIVEFNNELRNTKKWALNPWTDWFDNQDVASIDYIELDSN